MAPSLNSVFLAIALTLCIVQVHSVDYYWRDFDGSIPSDAIPAGLDLNKKPLYVGQASGNVNESWAISPVGLSEGKMDYEIAFNTGGDPAYTNETYDLKIQQYVGSVKKKKKKPQHCPTAKILCSTNKDNYKWVSTTYEKFPSVENVVQGGWGQGNGTVTPLYVGRCSIFGFTAVGRVETETDYFKNMVLYMHEGIQFYSTTFDVLTYQK